MSFERVRLLDAGVSRRLRDRRPTGFPLLLTAALAHSGDSLVVLPLLTFAWWRGGFQAIGAAPAAGAAILSAMALAALAKLAFRRARPKGDWGAIYRRTDPHSFPSGHAGRTMALATVILALSGPVPGLALFAWSFAVGISRVALGVHWFLDVLAGWALGLGTGVAAAILLG
ncbi:MAG: phosphatase PAP2 family protein [Spirochaetes bacterium]|nr:phosphatase PAP2 family protein [Spirochaetota bacterium]